MGHSRPLFSFLFFVFSIQLIQFAFLLDSNSGSLMLEATALPLPQKFAKVAHLIFPILKFLSKEIKGMSSKKCWSHFRHPHVLTKYTTHNLILSLSLSLFVAHTHLLSPLSLSVYAFIHLLSFSLALSLSFSLFLSLSLSLCSTHIYSLFQSIYPSSLFLYISLCSTHIHSLFLSISIWSTHICYLPLTKVSSKYSP